MSMTPKKLSQKRGRQSRDDTQLNGALFTEPLLEWRKHPP
jgi:hypothetical protein